MHEGMTAKGVSSHVLLRLFKKFDNFILVSKYMHYIFYYMITLYFTWKVIKQFY